ncbi:MAG: hypothetical protein JOY86_06085 [Candidatus Eremiobacteraeota bacterium]|nr:hypothetical protein [Candidatus Eremiobacteraeota bacterium]
MIWSRARVALAVAALGLAPGAAFASRAAVAISAPRPIASLSASDRQHLPDSTQVSVFKGKITTLGALRALHRAREQGAGNAAALGRRVAQTIAGLRFHVLTTDDALSIGTAGSGTPHAQTFSASELRSIPLPSGIYAGILFPGSIPTPTPGPKSPSVMHPSAHGWWRHVAFGPAAAPISTAALARYPKDYQNFCAAAHATACIYLPSGVGWQNWQGGFQDPVTNYVYDYLVVDPKVCQSEGGTMDQGSCRYQYPAASLANFTTGAAAPYAVDCPGGMYSDGAGLWIVIFDPRGAAEIQLVPSNAAKLWPGSSGSSPLETCVVQVFTS